MLLTILALFMFITASPSELTTLFIPVIVYLATWVVNFLKAKLGTQGFSGTIIMTMIVPLFSYLVATIYSYMETGLNFWTLFLLGLLGTFVKEILKQWKQSIDGKQTAAKIDLFK